MQHAPHGEDGLGLGVVVPTFKLQCVKGSRRRRQLRRGCVRPGTGADNVL